eukprot:4302080-Prymnesium_polylepis.1
MPSGAVGADLDDMFAAADEAGGTLIAEIYDEHWYDGVPTKAQAQKRYRARCAACLLYTSPSPRDAHES